MIFAHVSSLLQIADRGSSYDPAVLVELLIWISLSCFDMTYSWTIFQHFPALDDGNI